jgi:uncharacterized protein DUF3237
VSPSTPTLRGELLYRMSLEVAPPLDLGATPQGRRLLFPFKGGRFAGPDLSGEVLTTGGDWLIDRADGAMVLDVRRTLRTDDGHLIYAFYRGLLVAAPAVRQKMERGEPVAADEMYFRTTPVFETGSDKYGWLNRIISVGIGQVTATGVLLTVFKVA